MPQDGAVERDTAAVEVEEDVMVTVGETLALRQMVLEGEGVVLRLRVPVAGLDTGCVLVMLELRAADLEALLLAVPEGRVLRERVIVGEALREGDTLTVEDREKLLNRVLDPTLHS
jgi:hypothetical protein